MEQDILTTSIDIENVRCCNCSAADLKDLKLLLPNTGKKFKSFHFYFISTIVSVVVYAKRDFLIRNLVYRFLSSLLKVFCKYISMTVNVKLLVKCF